MDDFTKYWVDSWAGGTDGIRFFIGFVSGKEQKAFVLFPQGAKALLAWLQKTVGEYENQHGPIDMTGYDGGIPSPIQRG